MSRYDGLIIPRSYSEYINKTDAATLSQALQLNGVLAQSVSKGNNAAVTSKAVNSALVGYTRRNIFAEGTDYYTVKIQILKCLGRSLTDEKGFTNYPASGIYNKKHITTVFFNGYNYLRLEDANGNSILLINDKNETSTLPYSLSIIC